ncbi:MAG TPA: S9 family peptidase [Steroidobacteraceae bacterium]|nr:S9 family peptidase [Steroidobacteraceae bacterium]
MRVKLRLLSGLLLCMLGANAPLAEANGVAFTVEDLVTLKRVGDPQLSADGRWLVFVERDTDLEANEGRTGLWLIDLKGRHREPQRLLRDPKANDLSPRWAPDSRTLFFLSNRSGSSQVWRARLGDTVAERVTDYPLDVLALKVSPRGDALALALAVFPDCATLECTRERLDARVKDKAKGRSYERLFVRHWDSWSDGTRNHLFSARLREGTALAPTDVSRGFDADIPSKPFGSDADYSFSPDGKSLVFSARLAGRTEPWSTNFDLFEVPADGGGTARNLTAGNPANDTQPVFLANGDLAWLAQDRPGFESDRFHIMLRDAASGAVRSLTGQWDRSIAHLAATPDGKSLLASCDELGQRSLYAIDPRSGARRLLVGSGQVTDFNGAHGLVVFAHASLGAPDDLYALPLAGGGQPERLTDVNREFLSARSLSDFEQFSFSGWNGETVYGYLVKPYGLATGKRYPLAFVVHGGPQVSMANLWTYRWNAQAFAGGGYAVVMIDFHGSPGYGQAFTDSISHDWGGKPLVDLQKGLAAALARYPWIDGERACALGASYGGFMMNWIEGQWPERFRCIVNHDGIFDQRMEYYTTEELWFPEWEFGGPEYENPKGYAQFNPVEFVTRWRTPMLVIHGALDYRVPLSQGLGTFSALQRRGIESRMLVFPDENHWVLRPANSILWYHTVLGWLDAHLKN